MRGHSAHAQHFLRSGIAAEVVRRAQVRPGEVVVDLGAGTGALTIPLANRAARVVAVEADGSLVNRLRRRCADLGNVDVVHADARSVPLGPAPIHVVANPPFAHTSALLRRVLAPGGPVQRADLVVAQGVARLFTKARPGRAGPLVLLPWWHFRAGARLPARCFVPPPSVDAAVLVATRRQPQLLDPRDLGLHHALVRLGLGRRRHPLRRVLRGVLTDRQWTRVARDLEVARDAGAEQLTGEQWARLSLAVRQHVEPARWPRAPVFEHGNPRPA